MLKKNHQPVTRTEVLVELGETALKGNIAVPQQAHSLVLFAHGSGSSRLSPRNQQVAAFLNAQGIATFLFDLLTNKEDRLYANRFNIDLLCQRLQAATRWMLAQSAYQNLRLGYFGASTGAAAALMACRDVPQISAVVSRGGRPDLAMNALPFVKAPTLLIVGGLDTEVLALNQKAYAHLNGERKLEVVPGATHLFEEKGTMEKVCVLAANWFELYLQPLELHK